MIFRFNKNITKIFIKYFSILTFLCLLLFIYFTDQINDIFNSFLSLNFYEIIIIFIALSFRPIADSLRWYLILNKIKKIKFFELHEYTIKGYSLNLIGNTY